MAKLAFVDTETTGLDPDCHEIWEVALIRRDDSRQQRVEYVWQLPVNLGQAEARALTVGRYYERTARAELGDNESFEGCTQPGIFAQQFARLTHGAHLVGAVPDFDSQRLTKLLRANGGCPGWHYHLICVEVLAAGWLQGRAAALKASHRVEIEGIPLPWSSTDLSHAVGVDPERFDRHTARGDALWAEAIYDAVMGIRHNQGDA